MASISIMDRGLGYPTLGDLDTTTRTLPSYKRTQISESVGVEFRAEFLQHVELAHLLKRSAYSNCVVTRSIVTCPARASESGLAP